jgi:hypothetical protein
VLSRAPGLVLKLELLKLELLKLELLKQPSKLSGLLAGIHNALKKKPSQFFFAHAL